MRIKNKCKFEPNKRHHTRTIKNHGRTWKIIAIALYFTFILLSMIAFTADRTIETKMEESYEYHLRYKQDGRQTHYYVERYNKSLDGRIDLVYTTKTNSLSVQTFNIKKLHIFCRSMYEDECREVYGIDPYDNSNYYKWYFIEKNHFNVNIDADNEIVELKFIDTPLAYEVIVDGETWKEGTDYFYIENYGNALSHVPAGHTQVDLYFKPRSGAPPTAILSVSKTIVPINYNVMFDASQSFDSDGIISEYIFDFGDGTFRGGVKHNHYYSRPGIFGVILTVRDNDYLLDRAYVNITVVESSDLPIIQGDIPDQIKLEDSPPWSLNLSIYEPIPTSNDVEFYWYLTGENNLIYTVSGENDTEDRLLFTPVPDAYGNDQVTIWLKSTENLTASQSLWINITPVNDPPTLVDVPDIIIHYDDPYTFNYEPYVNDKETPKHDLILTLFDGYNKFTTVNGLNITYNYPQELVGEIIYATIMVSDGDAMAQDVISIQVTSEHHPKLIKSLPDVWLYEGTTKHNVFDLDDYFMDPDKDAMYYTYGADHLDITINPDHTVDITASAEWSGNELVTFRARDPMGALAEDSIIVTVLPVNDPPFISGVPNFHIRYDRDYRFDLTPYVYDNDNSTDELTIIPSDPEHIRLDINNNMVIILNYPIEYLGQSVKVRLLVSDGLNSSFQDITVTITEDFPPELLSPLPDIVFLEDIPLINAFNLDQYFLDVDGDVLYYTTGNKFINITINTDHTVDFSAPQDWFGTELTFFRATDPTGALQQDLVMVTVLPINDPPRILEIPPQYGNESERWTLELDPYIIDVDNNISELEFSVDSEFVVVSGGTLIFLGSDELPQQIELTVFDGQFTASQSIVIHLKHAKPIRTLTLWDLFMNILPFLILIILIIAIIAGLVYRKKSRFTTEEVFLIHKGGTLITHLTRHKQANVDDIIFSGMFTAVQEFIKDTFVSDASHEVSTDDEDKWALDELKLGDDKILIERSENTYLAVIFSGEGSKRLRKIVYRLLDEIETKYAEILSSWDGNIRVLMGTKEILSVLIKPVDDSGEPEDSKPPLQEQKPRAVISKLSNISYTPKDRINLQSSLAQSKIVTIKSQQIAMAKPLIKTKELLECTSEQVGVKQPGLLAWKMNNHMGKEKNARMPNLDLRFGSNGIRKFPVSLDIPPTRPKQKVIAMKKSHHVIRKHGPKVEKNLPLHPPNSFEINSQSKPLRIVKKSKRKKYEFDPTRSLLEQLADLEDFE